MYSDQVGLVPRLEAIFYYEVYACERSDLEKFIVLTVQGERERTSSRIAPLYMEVKVIRGGCVEGGCVEGGVWRGVCGGGCVEGVCGGGGNLWYQVFLVHPQMMEAKDFKLLPLPPHQKVSDNLIS